MKLIFVIINHGKKDSNMHKVAWFYDEKKVKWSKMSQNPLTKEYYNEQVKIFLNKDEVDVTRISRNIHLLSRSILTEINKIFNEIAFSQEKATFFKKLLKQKNKSIKKIMSLQIDDFEKYEADINMVLTKFTSLISKMLNSLIVLEESTKINFSQYNLKKTLFITELYKLMECFGKMWYYITKYDATVKKTREDEKTFKEWESFNLLLFNNIEKYEIKKNLKPSLLHIELNKNTLKIAKEIENLKFLRKILEHPESCEVKIKTNDKVSIKYEHYSFDLMINKNNVWKRKEPKKIMTMLEGRYDLASKNHEIFRNLETGIWCETKEFDVYKISEKILSFIYCWFLEIFVI